jgi:hypothetical protein
VSSRTTAPRPREERAAVSEPLEVPTRDGYDLWSQIYDDEDNPLIALEVGAAAPAYGRGSSLAVSIACAPRSASVASAIGASIGLNDGFRLSAWAR